MSQSGEALPLVTDDAEEQADSSLHLVPPVDQENTLFSDDTHLSREEALARFFTPAEICQGERAEEHLLTLPGVGEYAVLTPRSSFVMPQIREEYDVAHLRRTGRSIKESEAGQLQNCGVAFVDVDHIGAYLEDLNTFFESDVTLEDLRWHPEFGAYIITIFGHNRQIGLAAANVEDTGHPDHGTPFHAKVFRNPPFWYVLEMQALENTGLSPPPWNRSRSIVQYKKLRHRDGNPATQSEIAQKFGVDVDQIWRAERYEALPPEVRELVVSGSIPYSGAIELDRLAGLYSELEMTRLAHKFAGLGLSTKRITTEVQKRCIVAHLPPEIYKLVEEDGLTLIQAQELDKMRRACCSEDEIKEVAFWACSSGATIDKIRKQVSERVHNRLSGTVSIFTPGDDLDPEERDRILAANLAQERGAMIRGATGEVMRILTGLKSAYQAGLVGEAADNQPVIGGMDSLSVQVLEALAQPGEPDEQPDYTIVKQELEIALSRAKTPDERDEITEILALLGEVIEVSHRATGESQEAIRAELATHALSFVTRSQPKEVALF